MTQYTQRYAQSRLGVGDVISLRGAENVVASLDKVSGTYTAGLVFSSELDPNPRQDSDWFELTTVDTSDVVDQAVPATATAIATRVTVVPAVVSRIPAVMTLTSTALSGLHQRRRHGSGRQDDFGTPPLIPIPPNPQPPGNPILWFDGDDPTTMFQNAAGTTPVVNDQDPVVHWKNKGSLTFNGNGGLVNAVAADMKFITNWKNGRGAVNHLVSGSNFGEMFGTTVQALQTTPFEPTVFTVFSAVKSGPSPNSGAVLLKTSRPANTKNNLVEWAFGDPKMLWDQSGQAEITFTDSNFADNELLCVYGDVVNNVSFGRCSNAPTTISQPALSMELIDVNAEVTIFESNTNGVETNLGESIMWMNELPSRAELEEYAFFRWGITFV